MTEKKCFFRPQSIADGQSYFYRMHKTGNITGGSYPMASVNFTYAEVEIPRSKVANDIHLLARAIKIFFVILFPFLLYVMLELNNQPKYLLLFFFVGSTIGYVLVIVIYKSFSVKPKFRYAGTHPEVKQLKDKGYVQGSHAMISNSPFGILYYLAKILF